MNKLKMLVALACLALAPAFALAYNSGAVDPTRGEGEREYRVVKKSETAGVSDAVVVGDVLSLDVANSNDGYTVTRVGANTVVGSNYNVCIASKAIATGNVGLNRCVVRGYTTVRYDATTAISAGQKLCANSSGQAVVCAPCTNAPGDLNCRLGTASGNSVITSLEAKASGSGSDLKVLIKSR